MTTARTLAADRNRQAAETEDAIGAALEGLRSEIEAGIAALVLNEIAYQRETWRRALMQLLPPCPCEDEACPHHLVPMT